MFSSPTGAWQTDAHYWTVLLVATMLDIPNAQDLAYYAEYPDTKIHGDVATERYTWAIPFVQQNTHSLTGGDGPSASLEAAEAILNENPENAEEIGRLLHLFGDTYAHRKLDGDGELYGNDGFTLDHAASDGHAPDMIGNRPELFLEYVQTLSTVLSMKYGTGENQNFSLDVFGKMANYASNNGGDPISLIGIMNYEVAKAKGESTFFVHNVQGMNYSREAHDEWVTNTSDYLNSQGVNFRTEQVYKERKMRGNGKMKVLQGTRFIIEGGTDSSGG